MMIKTIEVEDFRGSQSFIPLIQLLAKLENLTTAFFEELPKEDLDLWQYQDLRIAYELMRYDEKLAIKIANIIKNSTGE